LSWIGEWCKIHSSSCLCLKLVSQILRPHTTILHQHQKHFQHNLVLTPFYALDCDSEPSHRCSYFLLIQSCGTAGCYDFMSTIYSLLLICTFYAHSFSRL
jgi:hypothetical protein